MEFAYLAMAVLLVVANGFFVATEFSMVKIRPSRVQALVEEGKPGALNALKLLQRMDVYLSATQFGITLASLGLGWIGEPAFAGLIQPLVSLFFSGEAVQPITHTISIALAFAFITFLHIVVGELGAKSLALQRTEATALAVA